MKFIKEIFEHYYLQIMIILCIISSIGWGLAYYYKPETPKDKLQKMSFDERISYLKMTYDYYSRDATSKELHVQWLKMFDDFEYKTAGNPNFERADCLHAVWVFLNSYGANVVLEEIPNMIKRLKTTSKKRTSFKSIKSGDIIIFKPRKYKNRKKEVWHIGIIEKTVNNYIFYMDVNALIKTRGFNAIKYGDKKIHSIYPITLSYWMGNMLTEMEIKSGRL